MFFFCWCCDPRCVFICMCVFFHTTATKATNVCVVNISQKMGIIIFFLLENQNLSNNHMKFGKLMKDHHRQDFQKKWDLWLSIDNFFTVKKNHFVCLCVCVCVCVFSSTHFYCWKWWWWWFVMIFGHRNVYKLAIIIINFFKNKLKIILGNAQSDQRLFFTLDHQVRYGFFPNC